MTDAALQTLSQSFEAKRPEDVLAYALDTYRGRIVLACSFGAEDVVLVDMIHRLAPETPLFYLDTDFLFPETHAVKDRIIEHYRLKPEQVIQVKSALTPAEQAARHGDLLWVRDPDRCCALRKIEPLTRTLQQYQAWITGIRRDQSATRANAGLIEWDRQFNLVKVNPLARWTQDDVWQYIRANRVPYNALHDQHYPSIGCTHCTSPVRPGEDPRSGRWRDLDKTECGIHK
ncbi:MAG TPA: phosphoadenylyl-sulfate reductase [Nitrospirales bacterium]|nr:phosphoadenylyl-sulfate reductase [Nitrospirales bacterium]